MSTNPTAGSDLTREWVTFDVQSVPEPNGWGLACSALLGWGLMRRR